VRCAARWRAAVTSLALLLAAPAAAQVTGSVTLQSDYRFRGYALGEQPAAILNLSWDHTSGLYLNGSAIGSFDEDNGDPVLLGDIANIGYARRLGPRLSIEGGVTRFEYRERRSDYTHMTEAYVGVLGRGLSARIHYSPDYFDRHAATVYGEVEAVVEPIAKLRVNAHLGVLAWLSTPCGAPLPTRYDWLIGLSRPVGPFDLHAALSVGGPGGNPYDHRAGGYGETGFTIGATWTF